MWSPYSFKTCRIHVTNRTDYLEGDVGGFCYFEQQSHTCFSHNEEQSFNHQYLLQRTLPPFALKHVQHATTHVNSIISWESRISMDSYTVLP